MEKCGLVILDASDFTEIMMKKNPSYEIEFSSDGVTVSRTENEDTYVEDAEKIAEVLSKALGEKVLGCVCVNGEDDYEVWIKYEPRKISINTKAGKICAEVSGDPDYPGIFVYYSSNDYDTPVDLCAVEAPNEQEDINIYNWTDAYSEDWTKKFTVPLEHIGKALASEEI